MIHRAAQHLTGNRKVARFCLFLAVLAALPAALLAQQIQPEAKTGFAPRPVALGSRHMAVTANPHATDAAVEILQLGGNAIDAAIAAQWVLNLVEPQSSGIGGGGFLLHWNAAERRLRAWDGRETAPRKITPEFARRADGGRMQFSEILASGKAVGVPGLAPMLAAAHRKHGKLRWERLLVPAIRLANNGFPISPRLHLLLRDDPLLRKDVAAFALYFEEDGAPKSVGSILRNPELAAAFQRIATDGGMAYHRGDAARRIVSAVAARGGQLDENDLSSYQPREREPVCGIYRHWRICGMPPPSSGGIAVLQVLGLLQRSVSTSGSPGSADVIHRFTQAGRLAFADRARYLADPDFVDVPQRDLLAPTYIAQRARLIDPAMDMGTAQPGDVSPGSRLADGNAPEVPSTTHLSIVDREGNAVALTSSIEAAFGSRLMVDGFLLNNELTDFSLLAEREGRFVANRAEPGKRPLSSMSPTLVFAPDGRLHAVLGSPGGSRIINYVARTLISLLDDDLEPATALSLGHIGNRNGATELERGRVSSEIALALERRGHRLQYSDMTSGLHVIVRRGGRWVGAADPRREGLASGD